MALSSIPNSSWQRRHYLFTLLLLLMLKAMPATAGESPLRVAVAANFAPVLTQWLAEFKQRSGIDCELISASTGVLYQQLQHGAPFDLFLAADSKRPQALYTQGLTAGAPQTYAIGKLALYQARQPAISLAQLAQYHGHFAIANPAIAPYGDAAKQALDKLGLWQQLSAKLVLGQNINQTFQQIRSGAVQVGIVALSQLRLNHLAGTELPGELYRPLTQQLVLMKDSKHLAEAQTLQAFLLSAEIQQQLSEFGYGSGNTELKAADSKESRHDD